jgi:type IV pilus assembly protein PilN
LLKANLSTRPFYNERAVHFWLLIGALIVAAATLFNAARVLRYSHSGTQLATEASRDEARAADLRQQAARLRATVDPKQIEFASTEAKQANELIDRRTFSWTELLNRFETTLPDEVRITAVRPKVDHGDIVLTINVAARSVEDVDSFMNNLDHSGAFAHLTPSEEHFDDQGVLQTTLETIYLPSGTKPTVTPAQSKGAPRR